MILHIIITYKSVEYIDDCQHNFRFLTTKCKIISPINMKAQILILMMGISTVVYAQKNCQSNRAPFIPLNDLGTGYFRGHQGGLYPGGVNYPSGNYLQDLSNYSRSIQALDSNGLPSAKGHIVFIGVGASNPRTEFQAFQSVLDTFQNLNSRLQIVNTCIGGQGVQKMNQLSDNYWKQADKMMDSMGLHNSQVQVAWLETENTASPDSSFPGGPQALLKDIKQLLTMMKQKYPNLKLCYLSARTYSGWVDGGTGRGLEYPRDYYNGWSLKWLIDSAIAQTNSGFEYKGSTPSIPMPVYATYNWTNGEDVRNDGFSVDCETDFGGDGLHLSAAGELKMGLELFKFFSRDKQAQTWFLEQHGTSVEKNYLDEFVIYPNPGKGYIHVAKGLAIGTTITIYNAMMEIVNTIEIMADNNCIDLTAYTDGIYFIQVANSEGQFVKKYVKMQ